MVYQKGPMGDHVTFTLRTQDSLGRERLVYHAPAMSGAIHIGFQGG
jgi:hypothetical protein